MTIRLTALTAATIALTSLAASAQDLTGSYTAQGLNANGSAYSGTVEMAENGNSVAITWTVGAQSYAGVGQREGRIVTVDWGAVTPVIYVVMPDRSLHGTWDNGRALEKLTPRQ